jgi:hypothetical protein
MSRQISAEQLYQSFIRGGLGIDDDYPVWTPLWALRARIWQQRKLRKDARKLLGKLTLEAIEDADPPLLRSLAGSLERMLEAERSPEYAVKADVYFAVEELNNGFDAYSRADLLWWLNDHMEAAMTAEDVDFALGELDLADVVPEGGRMVE